MFLVDVLRPKVFVELGTYYGVSYCAFCQAVRELGLQTRCYGVDTWQGDGITWSYDPQEVLEDLRSHHDPLYGSFSRLTQTTFDGARQSFRDGEIDLLHIDGYHTYESVRHDFESWLPKMSNQGVMVLHDINVRQPQYGVWRLWSEVAPQYPHFEFWHEHGLGILAVGPDVPNSFREVLLDQDEQSSNDLRAFFSRMGETWKPLFDAVENRKQNAELRQRLRQLQLELEQTKTELQQTRTELQQTHASDTWRLAMRISTLFNRLLPSGSLLRRLVFPR
jgi:hypothetical protein